MLKINEKKFKVVKGMVISRVKIEGRFEFNVYTKDEWSMGKGFRTPEFEGCGLEEAISQAQNY
jgi:hypothetical protein